MQELWIIGFQDLKELSMMQVPRCLQINSIAKDQIIHVFTDASNKAYGVTVSQQRTYETGETKSYLIMFKD